MEEYKESPCKLVILCAGVGSRLSGTIGYLHKSLVSVNGKPVINHIIDKFPESMEIVIAVGYQKELVKEYLELAYHDRNFKFVEVDKFTGRDSGPGYSLLCCRSHLQCPFIITPCDTIVESYPSFADTLNWVGVSKCTKPEIYCTIETNSDGQIQKIYEKSKNGTKNAYIGVAGISDYNEFWDALSQNLTSKAGEIQVSNGLLGLIECGKDLVVCNFDTWYDTGNLESLEKTRAELGGTNNLEKEGESLYFLQSKKGKEVVKFFKDPSIVFGRLERSKLLSEKGIVPAIKRSSEHFYAYDFIEGDVMSEVVNDKVFTNFLNWCSKTLWCKIPDDKIDHDQFRSVCKNLHETKTLERIQKWLNMGIVFDVPETINGYDVPEISELLNKIDWKSFQDGIPSMYAHGDLHFENIIVTPSGNFKCIDWRQDFSGCHDFGDVYYDLAKLYHGLIVHHKSVFNNLYTIRKSVSEIYIDIMTPMNNISCINILEDFIKLHGFDLKKVRILTSFIFLNIACLHHDDYNQFLWYLGKLGLYKILNDIM